MHQKAIAPVGHLASSRGILRSCVDQGLWKLIYHELDKIEDTIERGFVAWYDRVFRCANLATAAGYASILQ